MFRLLMDRLVSVERRYAFGLLGVLLAVASFYYSRERRPDVTWDIVNESNVLDVREQMPELSISFRGDDIAKKNLNLRILTLRLSNTGEVDILGQHYDATLPWGFQVRPGQLIDVPRVIGGSSSYLTQNATPSLQPGAVVEVPKLILDRGAYLLFEVRVLHKRGEDPQLVPLGKVAGVQHIGVTRSWQESQQPSLWRSAFGGTIPVQGVRLISYSVATLIILLALVVAPAAAISSFREKSRARTRESEVLPLAKAFSPNLKHQAVIVALYRDHGRWGLEALRRTLSTGHELSRIAKKIKAGRVPHEPAVHLTSDGRRIYTAHLPPFLPIKKLMAENVVHKGADGKWTVDKDFTGALSAVLNALSPKPSRGIQARVEENSV